MLFICPRCARAVSGHVVVVTPKSLMNSRRLITCFRSPEHGIVTGQSGRLEVVRSGLRNVRFVSLADIWLKTRDVCFTPKSGHSAVSVGPATSLARA